MVWQLLTYKGPNTGAPLLAEGHPHWPTEQTASGEMHVEQQGRKGTPIYPARSAKSTLAVNGMKSAVSIRHSDPVDKLFLIACSMHADWIGTRNKCVQVIHWWEVTYPLESPIDVCWQKRCSHLGVPVDTASRWNVRLGSAHGMKNGFSSVVCRSFLRQAGFRIAHVDQSQRQL